MLFRSIKFDITVSAISGIAGLIPTLDIIKYSKKILIANKESIICGWSFILKELRRYNCKFIPIDSEHFSIFNLIKDINRNTIDKIYLTASGGPFFNKKINFNKVTINQAIHHPVWKMGKKISVDSANLMNKILEIIEASLLFDLPLNKFSIIIHPKSLVHAIVQNNNGLSFFAYHKPDMKIPIFNSLYEELNNKKFFKNDFFNEKKHDWEALKKEGTVTEETKEENGFKTTTRTFVSQDGFTKITSSETSLLIDEKQKKLNEFDKQIQEAVSKEDYEKAAKLKNEKEKVS